MNQRPLRETLIHKVNRMQYCVGFHKTFVLASFAGDFPRLRAA